MIAQLDFARDQAMARFKGQEGHLVDPEPMTPGIAPGGFASLAGTGSMTSDTSACPKCGRREQSARRRLLYQCRLRL